MSKERTERAYRAVRLIGQGAEIVAKKGIGKAGSKAALKSIGKANIVLAVADAVISVAEMCTAYFRYKKVKEQTKQILQAIDVAERNLQKETQELKQCIEQQQETIADQKRVLKLNEDMKKRSFQILQKIEMTLEDVRAENLVGTQNDNRYQVLVKHYEDAAYQYKKLTDELYG